MDIQTADPTDDDVAGRHPHRLLAHRTWDLR